ncbi:MAG: DUF5131 family protein [Solirubrobacteraceae bacterium]
MSSQTAIEWTQATWNPVTGCSKVSPGCAHCYAETFAERFRGVPGHPYEQGFDLRLWPERLELPLRWRKPKRIFVNSMSDLFHPDVPEQFVAEVWGTMARAEWHTFQVLTKRPERMPGLLRELGLQDPPLANVWLGTSIENRRFVGRAEHLRRTPAAVRFISAEPLLGPLRCSRRTWPDGYTGPSLYLGGIDWLIAGGESGPRHRPVRPEWVRDLRDACLCEFCRSEHQRRADCALCGEGSGTTRPRFFFKQWGGRTPKAGGRQLDGRTWDELPRPQGPGDVSQPEAASGDVSQPAAGGALSGSPHATQTLGAGERDGQLLSVAHESSPDRAGAQRVSGATALSASPRARASRDTSRGSRGRARRDTSSSSLPARASAKLAAATSPIARATSAGSPSERKPAGSCAGQRVVRRSEPPAEPAAPSSDVGGSAPASTGDASLLEHEQPGVRELVLAALSASDKRLLLEGGTPRHELSTSSGPLRPEVTLRRREILVSQYAPAAWRSHLAWHSYWDRHGGFGGANLDDEQLMAASPPTPRSEHRKVRLTWGQARTWVREDTTQRPESQSRASRDTSRTPRVAARAGLSSRTRHDLDRAAQQLRDRFAYRPSHRAPAAPKWAWTDAAAQGCEVSIREVLADAARAKIDVDAVQRRSCAVLEVAHGLLTGGDTSLPSATHATRRPDPLATGRCAWCSGPMPDGLRPEARFCKKRCRQAASRAKLKAQPAQSPSPPPETCAWCTGPMPPGVRPEARFCQKRCRQAASRFDLAVRRALRPAADAAGPGDTSLVEPTPAEATRRSAEISGPRDASPARSQQPRCDQLRDGSLELRPRTVELVDAFLAVERDCFGALCVLFDRRGTLDPDAVVASQEAVHAAAERLRSWCADPDLRTVAELERVELLRAQVTEERAVEAAIAAQRRKEQRDPVRVAWNERRAWLYGARDALSVALGWPHRGERVTVTRSSDVNESQHAYVGPAIYLHSFDTHNVSCQVWVPERDRRGRRFELRVAWEPHEHWGCADPAGDIAIRRADAPDEAMPVPLPRWPTADEFAAITTLPAGEQPSAPPRGLRDTSPPPGAPGGAELDATRRSCSPSSRPRATRRPTPVAAETSRAMRFGYADPPYPGKSRVYRDHPGYAGEVDHAALISRLITEFPDGWALSTSAQALQDILALCPPGVRVCSWHRPVRRTRSRRPLSAWEPLIVYGGRELSTSTPQAVTDALEYRGRFRAFPGAITGMKAPQYAAWAFAQLGTRAGDELVDLFPGSGAVSEAWRRYTAAAPNDTSSPPAPAAPVSAGDVSPTPAIAEVLSDASRGSSSGSPGDVGRDTSPAPPLATRGSVVGEVSQCLECFGYSEPCAACVAAAGDPRPEEFAVRVAGIPGGQVDGTRRCACGRVYGTYHAGSLLCFVMQAPGRRQVNACVRCGAQLAAQTTTDCTPPVTDAAAPDDTSRQVRRAA